MLWLVLTVAALGSGHVIAAILYGLVGLAAEPRPQRIVVLTSAPTPTAPPLPYDAALKRRRSRRLRLVKIGSPR